ncbi:MAG: UvrD-helicase domain-containing protein [Candidatus Parcubacteria bacterium]|nr:UvrD-helicase domain-containing protein [Candidatus Parcubacteria bacterium]
MCSNNKLIIAAAGSGKTTFLVNEALKKKDGKILITTYTQANEEEIRRKFIKINKCIPENVTIQTWFSFLLQHGARPFQGCKFSDDINGLILINGMSAKGVAETDTQNHYFTKNKKIYSDKLSKFVVRCNEQSNGSVIDRLSRIYTDIFIDEVQDLAGYDLDFLKLIFNCKVNVLLVGDPRQGTYSTNNSSKHKKFKKAKIVNFFEDDSITIEKDDSSLTTNYRSCSPICNLSNNLYPDLKKTTSGNANNTGHDGVFFINTQDIKNYLSEYKPIQLRWDSRTAIDDNYRVLTFGLSKGQEFERVIIYPTPQFISWIEDNTSELAPTSRSKFYVAITRASQSVGIVCDKDLQVVEIERYIKNNV